MQRALTRGITCRLRGVDESGFRVLEEIRQKHLKRLIYIPEILKDWNRRLGPPNKDRIVSDGAKEAMRKALGAFYKSQSEGCLGPVEITRLPKRQKLFTVLKGPHIDKKAREQFFYTTYGVEMNMKAKSLSALKLTELLLRFYEIGTNEMQVTVRF